METFCAAPAASDRFSLEMSTLVQPVGAFDPDQPLQARSLGVLPWSVRPDGHAVVLLGREACAQSKRWAPFEGSAKPGETTEQGAAREFVEESLGLVRLRVPQDDDADQPERAPSPFVTVARAAAALERGAYSHRVQLRYHVRARALGFKEATTLIARVAYDAGLEERFAVVRARLTELARFGATLHNLRSRVEGPTALYGGALRAGGRQLRVVDVLDMAAFRRRADGTVAFEASVRCVDPARPEACRIVRLRLRMGFSACLHTVVYGIHVAVLRALLARARSFVAVLAQHPAVTLERDDHGQPYGVRVNGDFLEKDRVRYWTRDDLNEMMEARGHFGGGIFRSSSCGLVETILLNWDAWFGSALTAEEKLPPDPHEQGDAAQTAGRPGEGNKCPPMTQR